MAETKRRSLHNLAIMAMKEAKERLKTEPEELSERARLSLSRVKVKRRIAPDDAEDERMTRAMIDVSFDNIKLIRKRMANDQLEIDRLRRETRAMLTQILA